MQIELIYSTYKSSIDPSRSYATGKSMSTPHVAGTIALMLTISRLNSRTQQWTYTRLAEMIYRDGERIDAYAAVAAS